MATLFVVVVSVPWLKIAMDSQFLSFFFFSNGKKKLGELSQSNQRLELSSTRLDETQRRLDSRLGVISESCSRLLFHFLV